MSAARENPVIAVVDDDSAVAKGTQRLLQASGLNAIAFTSGAAFLESLKSAVPDCLLLDLVMPEPDGLTILARLKAVGMTFPVIFVSASPDIHHRRQALAGGAVAFLEKAVDAEVLLDAIASALRGANSRT
jgi:FixJ family two-component response regulator